MENRGVTMGVGLADQEYLLLQFNRVQVLVTRQRGLALERAQDRR